MIMSFRRMSRLSSAFNPCSAAFRNGQGVCRLWSSGQAPAATQVDGDKFPRRRIREIAKEASQDERVKIQVIY